MKVKRNKDMLAFKLSVESDKPVRKSSLDIKLKEVDMPPTRRNKIVF